MVKLLLLIIKMFSILKGPCNKQFHRNCVSQHLRQRVLPQGPMATMVLAVWISARVSPKTVWSLFLL